MLAPNSFDEIYLVLNLFTEQLHIGFYPQITGGGGDLSRGILIGINMNLTKIKSFVK